MVKMDFLIVQNLRIPMKLTGTFLRTVGVIPVFDQISPFDDSDTSWRVCQKLRHVIRNQRTNEESRKLHFTYAFTDETKSKLKCELYGPFIDDLVRTAIGPDLNVTVSLSKFCWTMWKRKTGEAEDTISCHGMTPRRSCSYGNQVVTVFEGIFDRSVKNGKYPLSAELTIRVCATVPEGIMEKVKMDMQDSTICKRALVKDSDEHDMEIVSADDIKISCHRVVLTSNSSVFERMLQDAPFEEGRGPSIVLEGMSGAGVKGLLDFLYFRDLASAMENFNILMELLETSEKYGIGKLQRSVKRILLNQRLSWFHVEDSIRLFCFTRGTPHFSELKKLAACVLKLKYDESPEYKMLFQRDPEAAMDLFDSIP